jgi:hypothetical protein
VWKPTLELLSGEKTGELIASTVSDTMTVASMMLIEKSEMLALDYIRTAIKQVSFDQINTPQLKQLHLWMQEQEPALLKSHTHRLRSDNSDWLSKEDKEPSKIQQEIKTNGPEGEALSLIGPVLESILQGSVVAKNLLSGSFVMTDIMGMSECRNKLKEVSPKGYLPTTTSLNILLTWLSLLLSRLTAIQHYLYSNWATERPKQHRRFCLWIIVICSNIP